MVQGTRLSASPQPWCLSSNLSVSPAHISLCRGAKRWQAPWSLLGRWSVLTYEAPKQSPPALKEEENGDSNIQVGTVGDQGLEVVESRLGGTFPFTPSPDLGAPRVGLHGDRSRWGFLGVGAVRGLTTGCLR